MKKNNQPDYKNNEDEVYFWEGSTPKMTAPNYRPMLPYDILLFEDGLYLIRQCIGVLQGAGASDLWIDKFVSKATAQGYEELVQYVSQYICFYNLKKK